jgi:ribosomal protein S18 acetylase RimI-like enzyme
MKKIMLLCAVGVTACYSNNHLSAHDASENVTVRPFDKKDLSMVLALAHPAAHEQLTKILIPRQQKVNVLSSLIGRYIHEQGKKSGKFFAGQYHNIVIENEDGKAVGFCRYHFGDRNDFNNNPPGVIERIAILPEFRKKGYATILAKAAARHMQKVGVSGCSLSVYHDSVVDQQSIKRTMRQLDTNAKIDEHNDQSDICTIIIWHFSKSDQN